MPFTIGGEYIKDDTVTSTKEKPKQLLPIKVYKEKRKGIYVTAVKNIGHRVPSLKDLAKELKVKMGAGGYIDDDIIYIQGDKIDTVRNLLVKKGIIKNA